MAMKKPFRLWCGDCLVEMGRIADKSVDMICCDLPYGTTACAWDSCLPFEQLWAHYKRIIRSKSGIVLFAGQPFTSTLIVSNLPWFKYTWIWQKSRPGGFVLAKIKPLKTCEDIVVFSDGLTMGGKHPNNMRYYPQNVGPGYRHIRPRLYSGSKGVNYTRKSHSTNKMTDGSNYPKQVLTFPNPNNNVTHPTQKPLALVEYLIRTYTNERDLVLDNCMGSGTAGIACARLQRNFIGIEKDPDIFADAEKRIRVAEKTGLIVGKINKVKNGFF